MINYRKEVVLYFPNNVLMAEFILAFKLMHVQYNSLRLSVTGYLTEAQIVNALYYYKAELALVHHN
jgi:hypothetical protein